MSVFDLVWAGLGLKQARRAVETPYTWPLWRERGGDGLPDTLEGFTDAGYKANALVAACIKRKAESAASAIPVIVQEDEDGPDPEPYRQLLRRPNPYMSWFQLQELLITYLDLDGNAYVYVVRDGPGGQPVALYPLRPDRVRPVPKDGVLLGYVYEPEGEGLGFYDGREPFTPEEIVHVKYPNPTDPFEGLGRGISPLNAVATIVDLDNSNTSFLADFFNNAAVPFGLLKTQKKLFDEDVDYIRRRLREQYAGRNNWHETMILDVDAEYQRLGLSIEELAFDSLDARNEARICAALGVPPMLVGAKVGLDRSTYSNAREAREMFWADMQVMYRRFADGYNMRLMPDGLRFDYDFSRTPLGVVDAERKESERGVVLDLWRGGLLRRDEARALLGLPPDQVEEVEDVRFVDEIVGQIRAVEPPLDLETLMGRRLLFSDNYGLRLKLEDRLQSLMEELLAEMWEDLRRALVMEMAARHFRGPQMGDAPGVIRRLRERLASYRRRFVERLGEVLSSAASLGVFFGVAAEDARRTDAGELALPSYERVRMDQALQQAAVEWAAHYADVVWEEFFDYRTDRVREAVTAFLQDPEMTLEQAAAMLGDDYSDYAALRIVTTEVTRAFNQGLWMSWQGRTGVLVWRTAADERVCPMCAPLGGSVLGEPVEARMGVEPTFVHPGGPDKSAKYEGDAFGLPPAHPNCRCWVELVDVDV